MDNEDKIILEYIKELLYDIKIKDLLPEELSGSDELKIIDETLRSVRKSVNEIAVGDLSQKINGKGYLVGVVKNLQATLKNITWQTRTVANGDFSQRIDFLGEFSDAFNAMVQKLEEEKELFEMVFKTIPDPTVIASFRSGDIFECNDAFCELTGYTMEELKNENINTIKFFKDPNERKEFDLILKEKRKIHSVALDIVSKNNAEINCLASAQMIFIDKEPYVLSVLKNITQYKEIENKLRDSEERHRLLAENVNDVIWTMDLSGKFTYVSPSVEKLRGYSAEEVMIQTGEEVFCPDSLTYLQEGLVEVTKCLSENLPVDPFRADLEQPCKDGSTVWADTTISGMYNNDNEFIGMIGVSRDISERKKMEEYMKTLSTTDSLTKLYNRLKLDELLKAQIEISLQNHSNCSLAILDIDFFKKINDKFGHPTGDSVLIEFANILLKNIESDNYLGRWGGEEFMIILPDKNIEEAYNLSEELRIKIEDHDFEKVGRITASFGVAEISKKLTEIELVAKADMALYKAKESGRNKVVKADIF